MRVLVQIGLVSLGSALGGLLRWGVQLAFARLVGTAFPWGTLAINLSGSFFLGWFSTVLRNRWVDNAWMPPDHLHLLLAVGFTGAYTTFSTFELEANNLLQDGTGWKGMAYMAGSLFLGLLAVRLGVLWAGGK